MKNTRSPLLISKREARRFQALIDRAKEEVRPSDLGRPYRDAAVLAFVEGCLKENIKNGGGK